MSSYLEKLIERYPALRSCLPEIEAAYKLLESSFRNGGKLLLCGNGGSVLFDGNLANRSDGLPDRFQVIADTSKKINIPRRTA